jgi:hypothetical protein
MYNIKDNRNVKTLYINFTLSAEIKCTQYIWLINRVIFYQDIVQT